MKDDPSVDELYARRETAHRCGYKDVKIDWRKKLVFVKIFNEKYKFQWVVFIDPSEKEAEHVEIIQ